MKKPVIFLFFIFISSFSFAQIGKAELKVLRQKEDSLKDYSVKIIQGINAEDRFNADSVFTRILVRSLKTKNSFPNFIHVIIF